MVSSQTSAHLHMFVNLLVGLMTIGVGFQRDACNVRAPIGLTNSDYVLGIGFLLLIQSVAYFVVHPFFTRKVYFLDLVLVDVVMITWNAMNIVTLFYSNPVCLHAHSTLAIYATILWCLTMICVLLRLANLFPGFRYGPRASKHQDVEAAEPIEVDIYEAPQPLEMDTYEPTELEIHEPVELESQEGQS